jgi:hypothetical protein
MRLEMDKVKENQSARNLQGKGGEDRQSTIDQNGETGNKSSEEGSQQIKVQDKIPSESP